MNTTTIINNAIDALRTAAFEANDERKQAEYQSAADDLEDALHDVQKEAEALDLIMELLDGREWDSQTMADVADIVRSTGRNIDEPGEDYCEECKVEHHDTC